MGTITPRLLSNRSRVLSILKTDEQLSDRWTIGELFVLFLRHQYGADASLDSRRMFVPAFDRDTVSDECHVHIGRYQRPIRIELSTAASGTR